MSTLLLVMTDGRDELLRRTIDSLQQRVVGAVSDLVIHTDNGHDHVAQLANEYGAWDVIGGERLGFGGAIERAWNMVSDNYPHISYVFSTEDDFLFNKVVDLDAMSRVMDNFFHIQQMALVRQAWNDEEKKAGGLLEAHKGRFIPMSWQGHNWLEHREWWTTNPSLIRMSRVNGSWPNVERSEGMYSKEVFLNPTSVCGYWGQLDDGAWVNHIGKDRVGHSY